MVTYVLVSILCVFVVFIFTNKPLSESQRIYWENKIVRIEKDTAEEVSFSFDDC